MYDRQKNAAQGKIFVFSLQYTQGKLGNFFYIFKKWQGGPTLPPLVAPLRLKKELAINFYGK